MDLDDLRRVYPLRTVVARYTTQDVTRWGIVCPMPHHQHANNTPSFSFYRDGNNVDRFYCYGSCAQGGDVLDFLGLYHLGPAYDPRNPLHMAIAVSALTREVPRPSPVVPRRPRPPFDHELGDYLVTLWQGALPACPAALTYLEGRGVLSVADRFRVGYRHVSAEHVKRPVPTQESGDAHYLSIPTVVGRRVVAVKFRRIDSLHPEPNKPLRYDSLAGPKVGKGQLAVFNHDRVSFARGPVFIPEGEFDVMLLEALGFLACCSNGGASTVAPAFRSLLQYALPIILADDDPAGHQHAERVLQQIGRGLIVPVPSGDVGQLYARSGRAATEEFLASCLSRLKNSALITMPWSPSSSPSSRAPKPRLARST